MISDTVLKRSVLNNIKNDRDVIRKPAGAAGDAVILSDDTAMSVKSGEYAVIAACNSLECIGAKALAVSASLFLPREYDERHLKITIENLGRQCALFGAQLGDISVNVTAGVRDMFLSATAVGKCCERPLMITQNGRTEGYGRQEGKLDIVAAGTIGLDGTRSILDRYREKACEIYTDAFIEKAYATEEELTVIRSAAVALKAGAGYIHAAGEGGIFAALWRMSGELEKGIDIDFRKIPVKQEIIEICEIFDINPYELSSLGCLLVTCYDGYDIVNLFRREGLTAELIGQTTQAKGRTLRTEDEVRYLEVPRTEELERIIFDGWDGRR